MRAGFGMMDTGIRMRNKWQNNLDSYPMIRHVLIHVQRHYFSKNCAVGFAFDDPRESYGGEAIHVVMQIDLG